MDIISLLRLVWSYWINKLNICLAVCLTAVMLPLRIICWNNNQLTEPGTLTQVFVSVYVCLTLYSRVSLPTSQKIDFGDRWNLFVLLKVRKKRHWKNKTEMHLFKCVSDIKSSPHAPGCLFVFLLGQFLWLKWTMAIVVCSWLAVLSFSHRGVKDCVWKYRNKLKNCF